MKKTLLIISLIGVIFLLGCGQGSKAWQNRDVKTVDDIKKLKEQGKPVSELDKCLKEAAEGMEKYEEFMENCQRKKLLEEGYDDDLNCLFDINNEECTAERSNAEARAYNHCLDEEPEEIENRITLIDCGALT